MRRELIGSMAAVLVVAACQNAPDQMAEVVDEDPLMAEPLVLTEPVTLAPFEPVLEEMGPPPDSEEYFVVEVGDRVFFGFDEIELSERAQDTLRRQAEWLRTYPAVRVVIEGHADERGTREYNLALGERRATAVRNYLVALGIAPTRVETVSYGKERPVALGSNETAWALNRRAVTAVAGGMPVN